MAISNVRIRESETWKEILSQGQVWQNVLQEISQSASVGKILATNTTQEEWIFVGCGSSYYLAQAAANSWTLLTGQRARALPASEVLLFPELVLSKDENALAVVISLRERRPRPCVLQKRYPATWAWRRSASLAPGAANWNRSAMQQSCCNPPMRRAWS